MSEAHQLLFCVGNWRSDADWCHWHAHLNPAGQMPKGDVRLTRRRSTAESYESRDPNDPKMAALRAGSSLAPMAPLPALPEDGRDPDRQLTMEDHRAIMQQRSLRMQQRFQARRVCSCCRQRSQLAASSEAS